MEFITPGYESLELSTQILIKEALRQNIDVEVLDWQDNFILLRRGEITEYVKQATRTSKDTYIAPLIMENKKVTKDILKKSGINVPDGAIYTGVSDALSDYTRFSGKGMVIKPNSTNFGLGVTIFKEGPSYFDYKEGVKNAKKFDSSFIIESFVPGSEFRFLVIGGEVTAVLHRVPANVTGDGLSSVMELVRLKNEDPLRGTGYKKPLEKLKTGREEIRFLKNQNLDFNHIPKRDEKVFLRENSNISTGGDSIDYTDKIPDSYKEIAKKAVAAVGAKICGLDMIIRDYTKDASDTGKYSNYSVIELNYNPAIHIHEFPFKGEKRFSGKKILKLLGFK